VITVGIDEVGRGCWAGPVVAGAVILAVPIVGLKDSKLLSKTQREKLTAEIEVSAAAFGLGWVQPAELDALGLTQAVRLAMQRALERITIAYDEIIIDGAYNFLADNSKARPLVKADNLIPAVAAASIIAKVARDRYMAEQALKFPHYHFERHVGYGTAAHLAALKQRGVCELHRLSYKPIKRFVVDSL
jgi:ribonuclease HII